MKEVEQQMISKFLEMRKRADRAEAELDSMRGDVADFGYLAALQFPDFIDHVCQANSVGHVDFTTGELSTGPFELVHFILNGRHGESVPYNIERTKDESSRHWMERIEAALLKKKRSREATL
jgi:hypothetical protein